MARSVDLVEPELRIERGGAVIVGRHRQVNAWGSPGCEQTEQFGHHHASKPAALGPRKQVDVQVRRVSGVGLRNEELRVVIEIPKYTINHAKENH